MITYLQRWEGAPRNAATVIDRHGAIVLTYAKVHTCDFGMEAALTPGDGFHAADLDLDELRAVRRHETWGDAYRKPHVYAALVADHPAPVFARRDSRRAAQPSR